MEDRAKVKARQARYHAAHAGIVNAKSRAWYAANKERAKTTRAAWRLKNAGKDKADIQAYQITNAEKLKATSARWRADNKASHNIAAARYRASKYTATPAWADSSLIADKYVQAAAATEIFGVPFHVDHSVPLQSKLVCGLHCEKNLKVVPKWVNLSKSNRYWPDMPLAA